MKNRYFQSLAVLVLILSLCLCLTGCDKLDYRKAITLYNEGQYDAAATLFSELDGYKDSGEMQTLCRYWEALTFMEDGAYSSALPRFLKLGDYEDSADRVIECKYQMAIAAFESEDYETAEAAFLEQPQYRKAPEYLRQITWQKFFDAVASTGVQIDGGTALLREHDGKSFCITATGTNQLILSVSSSTDMGYRFYEDLTLTLDRDRLDASFTATDSFDMEFLGNRIGSVQTASGTVDVTTCTIGTQLAIQDFQISLTDNHGVTSTSEDPADCLMMDAMTDNLSALLVQIPLLLTESGIEVPLADIGFPPIA